MCKSQGYIKIWRGILDECLYSGERFPKPLCWIDILLQAEWESGKVFRKRGIEFKLNRGQLATTYEELGDRWGMSHNTAKKVVLQWQDDGQVEISGGRIATIIQVVNYDKYQLSSEEAWRTDWRTESKNFGEEKSRSFGEEKTTSKPLKTDNYKNQQENRGEEIGEQVGEEIGEQKSEKLANLYIDKYIKKENKEEIKKENNREFNENKLLFSKENLSEESSTKKRVFFKPPTIEEIKAYLIEKNITEVDAEDFFLFYDSKGWMVGSNKMKNWHSAIGLWVRRNKQNNQNNGNNSNYSSDRSLRQRAEPSGNFSTHLF